MLELDGAAPFAWITALFGLFVGSFLNVCIHRLPLEGETVARPRRSRCPQCRRSLTWRENVPVLSWVLQRGRCRGCGWRIPVRYPLVELLTAGLWFWVATLDGPDDPALLLLHLLIVSGLLVATFVDFDHFEIPDEISLGGLALAPVVSLLLPRLHADTSVAIALSEGGEVDRTGALLGCLAGILAGGGVLLAIGWVGKRLFGRDAMGMGDVKLLAAAGGFVGPGGALAALALGTFVASFVGVGNLLRFFFFVRWRARRRGGRKSVLQAVRTARIAARYMPFGPYLGIGIGIVLMAWNDVRELFEGLLLPH